MNVFSYVRVSGLSQTDKDGPLRQRDSIQTFCNKHQLRLNAEFFEEGVSGEVDAMDRPKFADMLAKIAIFRRTAESTPGTVVREILGHPFDIGAIVVERMDRLARDLMVSEFLLRECRKVGVKVFCADQGELIDMASNEGDPTRKMLRQILGAIAEWDKSVTVRKLRAARLRLRNNGVRCDGKKPYGFYPGEKETYAKIRDLKSSGLSFSEIAKYLNAGGLKTRHGKIWTKQIVNKMHNKKIIVAPPKPPDC